MTKRWMYWLIVGSLLPGCTQTVKQVPTVPVSGNVLVDGKPVAGVEVRFISEKAESYGITNEHGNYKVAAGAQVGKNKVVFNKYVGESSLTNSDPANGLDETQRKMAADAFQGKGGPGIQRELIPDKYTTRETTPVEFDVPEDGTESANFKLPAK